jgi:hypothetical protein
MRTRKRWAQAKEKKLKKWILIFFAPNRFFSELYVNSVAKNLSSLSGLDICLF